MNDCSVSVVIPAYNSEAVLDKCLGALEQQTYRPLEIIVVDDGSTDQTVELAKQKKAFVLHNTNRKGAAGARNNGAYTAQGDIIAFTDSDCVPPSNWLRNIVVAFREEIVAAVAGGYSGHEGNNFIGKFAFLELSRRRKGFPDYVETAVSNNFAVRTNLFKQAGGFPEIFTGATLEDMALSFRISRLGKIRWLNNNGINHHFHETYSGYLKQQYAFARDTVQVYKKFPGLLKVKTHQGVLIYLESLIATLTLCAFIRPWPWAVAGLCLLWLINLFLLRDILIQVGFSGLIRAMVFIPIRDFNWVRGILGGFLAILRSILAKEKNTK